MEEEKMAWKEYAKDLMDRSEEVDKAKSHIGHLKKTNYNLCRKLFRRDEAIPKLRERLDSRRGMGQEQKAAYNSRAANMKPAVPQEISEDAREREVRKLYRRAKETVECTTSSPGEKASLKKNEKLSNKINGGRQTYK
ncbi:hypothetical protein Bbelb_051310 [Branchiostoma belcheri]|nr:hypothetical protein Bbelb_051310 [Branchiostoma belcheri]